LGRDRTSPLSIENSANSRHLSLKSVEQLGAIATIDEQLRGSEPRPDDFDLPFPVLGVDHVDASRSNRYVVDVAPPVRHTPVMQGDGRAAFGTSLERGRHSLLTEITPVERRLVLWGTPKSEDQASDTRLSLSDARLAVPLSPLVFPT